MLDRAAAGVDKPISGQLQSASAGRSVSPSSYRPDIDGLRAISIAAVVGFHAFPDHVRGGFVGVDVFFVISGYLITGIIIADLPRDEFSFIHFYARRIKRLFPALLLVLCACLLFGWYALLPHEYSNLGKHVVAGSTFVANYAYLNEAGYFDSALKPLLHLWSLGIEEQFYLFWPLMLVAAQRWRWNLIAVTATLILLSFVLNIWLVRSSPPTAFFIGPTRIWELLGGAMVALIPTLPKKPFPNVMSFAGVGSIGIAITIIDKARPFPGWWALLPIAGALLVIGGREAWLNQKILALRPIRYLGLISYPLYLWHWPLICFAQIAGHQSVPVRWFLVGLSAVLASATYELVERPIRRSKGPATVILLIVGAIVVALFGVAAWQGAIPARLAANSELVKIAEATLKWDYPGGLRPEKFKNLELWERGRGETNVLFFGDSTIQQYAPRIDQLFNNNFDEVKRVAFAALGGCLPIPHVREPAHALCDGFAETVREYVRQSTIDTIVIGAEWYGYFTPHNTYYYADSSAPSLGDDAGATKALDALKNMLWEFRIEGKRVVLILEIPIGPTQVITRDIFKGAFVGDLRPLQADAVRKQLSQINERLRIIAVDAGVEIIDPVDFLCDQSWCPVITKNGEPIYKDAVHLSASFVRRDVSYLDALVRRN